MKEPCLERSIDGHQLTLLGTAHVSLASVEAVKQLLESGDYDAVAVELCASRHHLMTEPDTMAQLDLFAVIRSGKAPLVASSLALGAYQQRLAEDLGIEPGAEMRAAVNYARQHELPLWLIDRDVGITLRRVYRSVPWWQRFNLIAGLLASVVVREPIKAEDVEQLKRGDMLSNTFEYFAEQSPHLYQALIGERDQFMAARLRQEITRTTTPRRILAVVGAGHLQGIAAELERSSQIAPSTQIAELNSAPPPSRWPRIIPWVIVGLVVAGFAIGFYRSPELGWTLIVDWVLINGVLTAIGVTVAGGHPLTIISAFFAAPLTSLNPTIGAGMVTGAIEAWLRKPRVADFSRLRKDAATLKGWWHNRVTRVLLVFILGTLGSAVGTYVAGFRIAERLLS
jgi:pheromone shutdown-related protein TraB